MTQPDAPYEAYVWAFFTGEGQGAEQVCLAVSRGSTALDWVTLNDGEPLLSSGYGTRGLRDPFLIRSHDGERFYLLATDLRVAGLDGGFATAQLRGSRYLEVWESTDLVHWGEQRHVLVSGPEAGNTWAPEAFWCEEEGAYVVYWASNLYEEADPARREHLTYNRLMYATTTDFRTFSEPRVWVDSVRGSGQEGWGVIDATVAREDGTYFRVYKDEGDMTLRLERSTDLLATVVGDLPAQGQEVAADEWALVSEQVCAGLPNGVEGATFLHGEGPSLFPANPGDASGARWYLFIDQPGYHEGPDHYVPFATAKPLALTRPEDWYSCAEGFAARMPCNADGGRPRHGTVVPVTAAERDHLLAALGPR